jgi:HD-like signal output (HDOD) protein
MTNQYGSPETISRSEFTKIFENIKVPALPQAITSLVSEIHDPEPDTKKLVRLIESEPQISARVLRTINSSQFALRAQVKTVQHAIALLGLNRIRSIILSFTVLNALPVPDNEYFEYEMFWTDTLMRALLARSLTRYTSRFDPEEAFTAMLLADIAVPILLRCWEEDYTPIMVRWDGHPKELSYLERKMFGWDHARAGAWILNKWTFPSELVSLVRVHNLEPPQIRQRDLHNTLANHVATAALLPSSLKLNESRCRKLVRIAKTELGLETGKWPQIIEEVRDDFLLICDEFQLGKANAYGILDLLSRTTDPQTVLSVMSDDDESSRDD